MKYQIKYVRLKASNIEDYAEIDFLQNVFEAPKNVFCTWQDSNLQSPDPKSGALSIRPQALSDINFQIFACLMNRISNKTAIKVQKFNS